MILWVSPSALPQSSLRTPQASPVWTAYIIFILVSNVCAEAVGVMHIWGKCTWLKQKLLYSKICGPRDTTTIVGHNCKVHRYHKRSRF
jgi:hypothetical protein